MVIPPSGCGTGSRGTTPHNEVNQEAAGAYNGEGGMSPQIKTICQGGAEAGVDPEDEMMGPIRDK